MSKVSDLKINVEFLGTEVANNLLDTIGALHTRNKGLQKGHATLTRRVQELEKELAAEKARGITVIDQWGLRVIGRDGECRLRMGVLDTPEQSYDPLDGVKACQGSRADFEALFKAPMEMAVAKGTLIDRAVDAIIADVMKPIVKKAADKVMQEALDAKHITERTAADHQLADDIYSLRRRIACDLHDWSQAAEPVLSRLAAAEHAIKLQNELRRTGR